MLKPIRINDPIPEFVKRVQIKMRVRCNMDLYKRRDGMVNLVFEFKALLKVLKKETRRGKHPKAIMYDWVSKARHIEYSLNMLEWHLSFREIRELGQEEPDTEYFYIPQAIYYESCTASPILAG